MVTGGEETSDSTDSLLGEWTVDVVDPMVGPNAHYIGLRLLAFKDKARVQDSKSKQQTRQKHYAAQGTAATASATCKVTKATQRLRTFP